MEVFFYVADDIQPLSDSKTLMVGVFTDRIVTLNMPKDSPIKPSVETPVAIPGLSLMLTITGLAQRERTVAPVLKYPNGEPSHNIIAPMPFMQSSVGNANLLLKFTPFVVTLPGKYTLTLEIDGEQIEESFHVLFNEV